MFGLLGNKTKSSVGMLNTPWTVGNVKSLRTDEYDEDTGEFVTSIGNGISGSAGHTYPVDSTAIQSARFDPSDNSLNIVYRGGGKEYKFAADGKDAADWLQAPSKGRLTQEWRATHRYPGY